MNDIRNLVVAYDNERAEECLYVNGKKILSSGSLYIDSVSIAEAVGNKLIRIERLPEVAPKRGKPWPKRLKNLKIAPGGPTAIPPCLPSTSFASNRAQRSWLASSSQACWVR